MQFSHQKQQQAVRPIQKLLPSDEVLLSVALISLTLIVYFTIPLRILVAVSCLFASVGLLCARRIHRLREKGLLNRASEGLRQLLLERSIYDLLADLWYFPIVPKYLAALFLPFISKQNPEQTIKNFDELAPGFKKAMLTKGLINLFPLRVRLALLPEAVVHPPTGGAPPPAQLAPAFEILEKITKPELQSEYYQNERWLNVQKNLEQTMTFENNKFGFIKKFLQGSQNVTQEDYKMIRNISFYSSIIIAARLYFSKSSRFKLKSYAWATAFFFCLVMCCSSVFLLLKYKIAQRSLQHRQGPPRIQQNPQPAAAQAQNPPQLIN